VTAPNTVETLKDVSRFFKAHPETVRGWVKKGMPRKKKPGYANRFLYDLKKIEEWKAVRIQRGGGAEVRSVSDKELAAMKANVEKFRGAIDFYKVNRADIFANKQLSYQKKADYILSQMSDDEIQNAKLTEKLAALKVLDTGAAIYYDKERLERGESTQNVSMIVGAIKELKRKQSGRKESLRETNRTEAD